MKRKKSKKKLRNKNWKKNKKPNKVRNRKKNNKIRLWKELKNARKKRKEYFIYKNSQFKIINPEEI